MKRMYLALLGLSLPLTSFAQSSSDVRPMLRDVMENLRVSNCVEKLEKIEKTFVALKPADYLQELSAQKAESLGKEIWDFKLKIHDQLRAFHRSDRLTRECANAYRGAFRAVRYAEDLVQEHQLRINPDKVEFPAVAWVEDNPHVKRNPRFEKFNLKTDLKSGDVILTRGNAYTSSAIASLGEFDTQFSHLSLVYIDKDGKAWTVEAHIEVGSFVRPLEDHIRDNNFRTMIFRHDDEKLAAKAAEYIFKKVKAASDSTGNILYDFGFSMEESEKLFCSEIVSHAFAVASGDKLQLPMFKSRLLLRKESFVRDIGITAAESFIPADMEIDPRFDIIAEWRDANRVKDSLEKDAVLQAMYRWVDDYGYKMNQASSRQSLIYRNVAWPMRRVPFLKKYFKDKLPLNMSRELIGYFGVLEGVGELLHKELTAQNQKSIEERGLPLLREEMDKVLDEFRLKDLGSKKKKLHKMFGPAPVKAPKS
ncbi:MAG: YiiX/YebB-like N1pC/P60 family cysteine hydrolase [Bacteriovoracia bacterium]